jgi:hypothetical protein
MMMGSVRRMDRLGWALTGIVLAVAGCCRSTGPTHKCDFTPPNVPEVDAGPDGPMPCGTAICDPGKVCCYKKSPALALCIDPENFVPLGCEMMDLPCFSPKDCPDGLSCCVNFSGETGGGTVTCRPQLICLGEGAYVACEGPEDCPFTQPACTFLTNAPNGDPFNICQGGAPPAP